jgi:SAM-dependent methyltransferase
MPAGTPTTKQTQELRDAIRVEYTAVAEAPARGFHFPTGRPLAARLGYPSHWLEGLPEEAIESFAGTGNPFRSASVAPGARVVDVGCGAGLDSLIAARMTGPRGRVIGVEMTEAMRTKAQRAAEAAGATNVEIREGYAEALPVPSGWADIVISNGVLNLVPDKAAALAEMSRVLRPGGRLQIADILVERPVSEAAKERIDLWTG